MARPSSPTVAAMFPPEPLRNQTLPATLAGLISTLLKSCWAEAAAATSITRANVRIRCFYQNRFKKGGRHSMVSPVRGALAARFALGYSPAVITPIVAIDGPAGAGKSTVARQLARRLGFTMIDTGAIYRSVALAARRGGVAWDDDARLGKLIDHSFKHSFLSLPDTDVVHLSLLARTVMT